MNVRQVKVTINGQSRFGTLFKINSVVVEDKKIKSIGMVEFEDGTIEGVNVNFIKMLYPNQVSKPQLDVTDEVIRIINNSLKFDDSADFGTALWVALSLLTDRSYGGPEELEYIKKEAEI